MAVTPERGLRDDYDLKLNSYDLGVDIELHDIVQRLRFEHPEVRRSSSRGGIDKVFCAGANIQMLATSTARPQGQLLQVHQRDPQRASRTRSANSGQAWIAAVNGTAAGGGYELALACDEILLIDDRSSAVSLPEVPLLAVLPGTGGLTRLVDKRHVRRDLADVFATRTEGVKGQQAVDWGLVDAVAPRSSFDELVARRGPSTRAADSDRPDDGAASRCRRSAARTIDGDGIAYRPRRRRDRPRARRAPGSSSRARRPPSRRPATSSSQRQPTPGCSAAASSSTTRCSTCASTSPRSARGSSPPRATPTPWSRARERADRATRRTGSSARSGCCGHARCKRLDLSARTLVALVEPGSCFAGHARRAGARGRSRR